MMMCVYRSLYIEFLKGSNL